METGDDFAAKEFELVDGLVGGTEGAGYEFGCTSVEVALEGVGYLVWGAEGTVFGEMGVGAGAGDVGFASLGGFFDGGGDVEADEGSDVVVVDSAAEFRGGGENDVDAFLNLLGCGCGDEPAVGETADATGGGLAAAADPKGHEGLLHGLGSDADLVEGEELAVVGDEILAPEAAHHFHGFVTATAAVFLGDAAGFVFAGVFLAEADGGQEAAVGEVVEGCHLLGEDDGVAEWELGDGGAELHFL